MRNSRIPENKRKYLLTLDRRFRGSLLTVNLLLLIWFSGDYCDFVGNPLKFAQLLVATEIATHLVKVGLVKQHLESGRVDVYRVSMDRQYYYLEVFVQLAIYILCNPAKVNVWQVRKCK